MAEEQTIQPFRFNTRLHLSELTGLRASTVEELLAVLRDVSGSSIYHHTHRFLQQHEYLSPEPPNDFAYWVAGMLNEDELGERLASIDTVQYATIRSLREKIIETIEAYTKDNPDIRKKAVSKGDEFHFMKSVSFIFPTDYVAYTLADFADILEKITTDSIYYHVFEARLRLEKGQNDFSNWIIASFGNTLLAEKIAQLDPYTYTVDQLRKTLLRLVRKHA